MKKLCLLVSPFASLLVNGIIYGDDKLYPNVEDLYLTFQNDNQTAFENAVDISVEKPDSTLQRQADEVVEDAIDIANRRPPSMERMKAVLLVTIVAVVLACIFHAIYEIKPSEEDIVDKYLRIHDKYSSILHQFQFEDDYTKRGYTKKLQSLFERFRELEGEKDEKLTEFNKLDKEFEEVQKHQMEKLDKQKHQME